MSKFQQLYNESEGPEQKEELVKQGVRLILREEKKQQWADVLTSEYGITNGGAKELKMNQYKKYYKILAVAASLMILIFVGQKMLDSDLGTRELALSYLHSERIQHPGVKKGIADADQNIRQKAIEAFDDANYEVAIDQFDIISELTNEDRFYLSVSYLYIQEYERSIEDLGSLKQDTTIYNDEINWYYSLALILNGDIEKAKKSLTRIGTNGWNFSKAQVLLKSLE